MKVWLDSHFNKEQIHANWWNYWHTPNIWQAFQSGLPNCLLTLRQISSNPKSPRWFYFFHQNWKVRHPKCEEYHIESTMPILSPATSSSNLGGHFTGIVQMKVRGAFGRLYLTPQSLFWKYETMVGCTNQYNRPYHFKIFFLIILWEVAHISLRPLRMILPIIPYLGQFVQNLRWIFHFIQNLK